ncbi:MAG TPA: agenet domain-containing protein [Pyrinomonadaceae bacterium]|nr:agenet domain-containing protein [Pyrinomonadaceae bacterium]
MTKIRCRIIGRFVAAKMLLLILCAVWTAPGTEARGRDWEPQRTWVFVVGALRFKHADMFDSFPQENRRDAELVAFFRQQGVPPEHIVYLRDREATAKRIQNSLTTQLSKAKRGDLLFLYYTGHGYKSDDDGETFLASYDAGDDDVPGWAVNSIPAAIERYFKGSRAFIALDNCYSGALAEEVTKRAGRVSYAALTSSTSDQSSTGEWTFTEGLLATLRGRASEDTNGDGEITLEELAGEVKADMSFAENQRAVFTVTGDFSPQTVLSEAEIKSDPRVGERVEVKSEGSWYKGRIINADRQGARFLIHYYGWDDSFDEWVGARQIRRPKIRRFAAGRNTDAQREDFRHSFLRLRGVSPNNAQAAPPGTAQ